MRGQTDGTAVAIPQVVCFGTEGNLESHMPLKNVVPPTSDPAFMEI